MFHLNIGAVLFLTLSVGSVLLHADAPTPYTHPSTPGQGGHTTHSSTSGHSPKRHGHSSPAVRKAIPGNAYSYTNYIGGFGGQCVNLQQFHHCPQSGIVIRNNCCIYHNGEIIDERLGHKRHATKEEVAVARTFAQEYESKVDRENTRVERRMGRFQREMIREQEQVIRNAQRTLAAFGRGPMPDPTPERSTLSESESTRSSKASSDIRTKQWKLPCFCDPKSCASMNDFSSESYEVSEAEEAEEEEERFSSKKSPVRASHQPQSQSVHVSNGNNNSNHKSPPKEVPSAAGAGKKSPVREHHGHHGEDAEERTDMAAHGKL